MKRHFNPSTFIISIDVQPTDELGSRPAEQTTSTLGRVVEMLAQHQLPATWAIGDPGRSPVTQTILRSNSQHEIALLGDRSWVGRSVRRTHFARQLGRRVRDARSEGLNISSLLLSDTSLNRHHDLLVKHEISMVRPSLTSKRQGSKHAKTVCYGVWQLPADVRFPGGMQWLPGGDAVAVRQTLKRSVANGSIVHLSIDIAQLAKLGRGAIYGLNWVFAFMAKSGKQGGSQVQTLSERVDQMAPRKQQTRSQSILRKFAA